MGWACGETVSTFVSLLQSILKLSAVVERCAACDRVATAAGVALMEAIC
jgi:hypothetical protein